MSLSPARAQSLIASFKDYRIAVIGDVMLDRYIWGSASRISQEAPVPVVAVDRETSAPGGAANVMHNLAALGARALAFGVVGADLAGATLTDELAALGVDTGGIVVEESRPTTQKTRLIAAGQQVARIDREVSTDIADASRDRLLDAMRSAISSEGVSAIIVEDYAKGVVTADMLDAIVARGRSANTPVALDPHPAHHYAVNGLTLMTPNRAEALALAGIYDRGRAAAPAEDVPLLEAVARIREAWQPKQLLVTLGAHGMALFLDDGAMHHVPTRAREVFDVSGAGDTVIATFTLALCAGASPEEACELSNRAAGVVVGKVGTAPIHAVELLDAFAS